MIQTLTKSNKPIAMRKSFANKAFTGTTNKNRAIDETQLGDFGRLLYSKMKEGKTLNREQVAELVGRVRNVKEVSEREAGQWISRVRGFFIHEYNEILIYVRPQGYKIAEKIERVDHVGKIGHMTLKWRQRFMLTASVLSKPELEAARANYIARLMKDEKSSALVNDNFILEFKENAKLISREVNDAHKKIAA